MITFRDSLTRIVAAFTLLAVSGCLDTAEAPQATNFIGLRGAVYASEEAKPMTAAVPRIANAAPTVASPVIASPIIASMGLDEDVATASIAASLKKHPQFDIQMGYAPGNGAEALKAAMTEALAKASPLGRNAHYKLRGAVTVANLDTGKMQVNINWQVMRADGATIGQVSQTGETAPSDIAAYWGDVAKTAAEPAAEGVIALISAETRQASNAS